MTRKACMVCYAKPMKIPTSSISILLFLLSSGFGMQQFGEFVYVIYLYITKCPYTVYSAIQNIYLFHCLILLLLLQYLCRICCRCRIKLGPAPMIKLWRSHGSSYFNQAGSPEKNMWRPSVFSLSKCRPWCGISCCLSPI